MIWNGLLGHDQQVIMFRRSLERGRLAHAYLLAGVDGIGKRRFALNLAQCLLCDQFDDQSLDACGQCSGCRQVLAGSHPDLFLITAPEGKRDLPIEAFVGAKPQRGKAGLCFELSRKPMLGNRKIAVIDDANLMNEASGNALLKTLEEPPHGSLLLLVCNNADAILPTIRSRCQHVHFRPLDPAHVVTLLVEQGLADNERVAETVSGLCQGSLATASQLLGSELHTLREELYAALGQGAQMDSVGLAARLVDGVEKLETAGIDQRQGTVWLLDFVTEFYRDVLLQLTAATRAAEIPQAENLAGVLAAEAASPVEIVGELIECALDAQQQMASAIPVGLCLEGLLDAVVRISARQTGRIRSR